VGEIIVLNEFGDVRVEWDPADSASVERAKAEWKDLKKQGYEFYAVEETKGKRVQRFDRKLGRVIAAPGAKTKADREKGTRPRAMAGGPNDRVVSVAQGYPDRFGYPFS